MSELSLGKGYSVGVIYMDVLKAFETIDHNLRNNTVDKLSKIGFSLECFIALFSSFSANIKVFILCRYFGKCCTSVSLTVKGNCINMSKCL